MRDVVTVYLAELARKVRSRPFVIGTIAGMATIALLVAIPSLVARAFTDATQRLVIAGPRTLTVPAKKLLSRDYDVVETLPLLQTSPDRRFLDAHHRAGAVAELRAVDGRLRVTLDARDPSLPAGALLRDLLPLNIALATHRSIVRADALFDVPLVIHGVDPHGRSPQSVAAEKSIAYGLVFLLYLSTIFNSQIVMTSVAEEKTSRVAELLIAAVAPSRLLAGKIAAAGTVAIMQLVLWLGTALAFGPLAVTALRGFAPGGGGGPAEPFALSISGGAAAAFAVFFVLGFLQYATLYAGAASLISRTEDLGSVAAPLIMPVVGAFLFAQYALAFPNAPSVIIVSQLPLVAPFVMFTRIAVTDVPIWQIASSIVINVLATIAIVFGAAKLYRVGMLFYGRPPRLSQILTALRS